MEQRANLAEAFIDVPLYVSPIGGGEKTWYVGLNTLLLGKLGKESCYYSTR